MSACLVTGGCGFVGRHLIRRLLEAGHEVHCVDSLVPLSGAVRPERWPLFCPLDCRTFHFHEEDCRDYFLRNPAARFDYTFHLAAIVGGREMIERNPLAVAEDLAIDAGYWKWAVGARPAQSVVFSSSAAYPTEFQRAEGYRLLREDMIAFEESVGVPDMTYGWAKLTNEYLARLARERHGLASVVYRPFSGYGEDQDESYPFPSICRRILRERGAPVIRVWGSGRQMRDFIHIDDCVDGVLRTMDQVQDASAVNLSTGIYTSFAAFVKLGASLCGFNPEVVGSTDKPEGVFARAGDTALQRKLGFAPAIDLRTGIARALELLSGQRP